MRPGLKRIGALVLAAALLSACGGAAPETGGGTPGKGSDQQTDFRILNVGTADSGGSMFPASAALVSAINYQDDRMRFNLNASTGSLNNVEGLMDGTLDLALVSGDVAAAAVGGTGVFEGKPQEKLRAVAALYMTSSNWLAARESGMFFVHQLVNRSVAIGPERSATELAARTALQVMGIDEKNARFVNAGLGSGTDLLAQGRVSAVHGFAGPPIPGLARAASENEYRLLQYTDQELDAILEAEPAYVKTVIPPGTYPWQREPVATFGVKCVLCVNSDTDEELMYHLTELFLKVRDHLAEENPILKRVSEPNFCFRDLPAELHPGVLRCLKEQAPELLE